jgi:hypothetical protein
MACEAQREAADLKKKLEDTERKGKDAATDLQVMIEGKFPMLPRADSVSLVRSRRRVFDLESLQALRRPRRPSRRSWLWSRTR